MALASRLDAGALMVSETVMDGKRTLSTMSVGDKSIRVDVKGEKDSSAVIFRGDKKVFWVVDSKKKTYQEITKAQVEKAAAQMRSASAQMESAMKDMTAEQKAMMRKFMGNKMAAASKDDTPRYVRKASGEKAGKWTADRYEAPFGKNGVQKVWAASRGAVQLTESDMAALKEMSAFFEKFGANKSDYFKFDRKDLGFSGVPVKTEIVEGGKTTATTLLREVTPKNFQPSTFDLPAGYKKVDVKGL
jgi:hypothetical protein